MAHEKNCIIVHGCPSEDEQYMDADTRTYDKHWMPWLLGELALRGIAADAPLMPEPWDPVYEHYKKVFDTLDVHEGTVLVAHSCGSAFLVNWLGRTKRKVAALILVAPWKLSDENDSEENKQFYEAPIDKTISSRVSKIVIFTSDNEASEGKQSVAMVHAALGGEVVSLPGRGHYTLNDMGTEEFPELLTKILEI